MKKSFQVKAEEAINELEADQGTGFFTMFDSKDNVGLVALTENVVQDPEMALSLMTYLAAEIHSRFLKVGKYEDAFFFDHCFSGSVFHDGIRERVLSRSIENYETMKAEDKEKVPSHVISAMKEELNKIQTRVRTAPVEVAEVKPSGLKLV